MSEGALNHYNVLGIKKSPKTTQREIYNAYCKMAIRWHPDKVRTRPLSCFSSFSSCGS
jgi:DnaJ-class molecular chaperone